MASRVVYRYYYICNMDSVAWITFAWYIILLDSIYRIYWTYFCFSLLHYGKYVSRGWRIFWGDITQDFVNLNNNQLIICGTYTSLHQKSINKSVLKTKLMNKQTFLKPVFYILEIVISSCIMCKPCPWHTMGLLWCKKAIRIQAVKVCIALHSYKGSNSSICFLS